MGEPIHSKLGLGTAQFGSDYGIANASKILEQPAVMEILEAALRYDILFFDSAPTYGVSEALIGDFSRGLKIKRSFDVVSKIPAMQDKATQKSVLQSIQKNVKTTLRLTNQKSLYALLFHRVSDLTLNYAKDLYSQLLLLREHGVVKRLGVSVYDSQEIDFVLENFDIDVVQIPVSIFDQRIIQSGHLDKLRRAGIEVHARSIFLQGLIFLRPEKLPKKLFHFKPFLKRLNDVSKSCGISKTTLAILFVHSLDLDRLIVGVNSAAQLLEIVRSFHAECTIETDFQDLAVNQPHILNPANWGS